MRQIHHWAAQIFVAGIVLHLLRVFFTGAFRKPRELNWLIGVTLLVLALLEGFRSRCSWCLRSSSSPPNGPASELQGRDRERILDGRETGIIKRLPHGELVELHTPISAQERHTLMARQTYGPISARAAAHGRGTPVRRERVRARLSRFWHADTSLKSTATELTGSHYSHPGDEPAELPVSR